MALGVRDAIEGRLDVATCGDRLPQAPRVGQAVGLHRTATLKRSPARRIEIGPHLMRDQRPHPRGEGLVEPQVIPPGHRDVVAEPHVRDLVRGDADEELFKTRRQFVGSREQRPRRVRDEPRILHCSTERGFWVGNEIELWKRVRKAEVLLGGRKNCTGVCGGVGSFRTTALGREDRNGRGLHPRLAPIDRVEIADRKGNQIAWQWRRPLKREIDPARFDHALEFDGHIANRTHTLGYAQRQRPRCLHVRFVKTRKGAPRVEGLELRKRVPEFAILLAEHAYRIHILNEPHVTQREPGRPDGERRVELQLDDVSADD